IHTRFVHDQQNEINRLSPNLQAKAAAANGKVGGRPPGALRSPTTDQSFAVLPADDEAAFFDRRKNRDTMRAVEQFLRNALIGSGHNFLEGGGGLLRAFAFFGFGTLARRTLN